jgi:hypothetical protein
MTKISQYALDSTISKDDKVLGTDYTDSTTKNFSVEDLAEFILTAPILSSIQDLADDTAAAAAGLEIGQVYRTGSVLKIRVA